MLGRKCDGRINRRERGGLDCEIAKLSGKIILIFNFDGRDAGKGRDDRCSCWGKRRHTETLGAGHPMCERSGVVPGFWSRTGITGFSREAGKTVEMVNVCLGACEWRNSRQAGTHGHEMASCVWETGLKSHC